MSGLLGTAAAMKQKKGKTFDPEGTGYDEATAKRFNLKRDASGHMASAVPLPPKEIPKGFPRDTSLILKGMGHETIQKEIDATPDRQIVKGPNGRYYSIKRK